MEILLQAVCIVTLPPLLRQQRQRSHLQRGPLSAEEFGESCSEHSAVDFHGCTCSSINPTALTSARARAAAGGNGLALSTAGLFPKSPANLSHLESSAVPSLSPPCPQLLCPSWELWMLGWHPLLGSCPFVPRAVQSPSWVSPKLFPAQGGPRLELFPVLSTLGTPSSVWGQIPWWHHMSPGSSISSALLLTCQKKTQQDFFQSCWRRAGKLSSPLKCPSSHLFKLRNKKQIHPSNTRLIRCHRCWVLFWFVVVFLNSPKPKLIYIL